MADLAAYYKDKMLTNNFSFREMVHSDTAKREGINNVPNSPEIFENLIDLCRELQKIRNVYGPMKINSGFRSEELNVKIKGSKNSQHLKGCAADFVFIDQEIDLFKAYKDISNNPMIGFDQIIFESKKNKTIEWIHFSVSDKPRRQSFIIAR